MGKCVSKKGRSESEQNKATREAQNKVTKEARAWLASEVAKDSQDEAQRVPEVLHVVDAEVDDNAATIKPSIFGAKVEGLAATKSSINDKPDAPNVTFGNKDLATDEEESTAKRSSSLFKKGVRGIMVANRMSHIGGSSAEQREEAERIQLQDLLGKEAVAVDAERVIRAETNVRKTRPLSANSLSSETSTLTLTSEISSALRFDEWDRSSDRNLCHVYRLCEEYQQLGCGQLRPDRHIRGVDIVMNNKHTRPEVTKMSEVTAWSVGDGDGMRKNDALRKCEYWKMLGTVVPGLFAKLSAAAVFEIEAEGQVIFRQGDVSGNVYFLVSGEVDVHRLPAEELTKVNSPRAKDCTDLRTLTEAAGIGGPRKAMFGRKRRQSTRRQSAAQPKRSSLLSTTSTLSSTLSTPTLSKPNERFITSEGYSTFTATSNIGDQVARRGPNTAIGEKLALAKGIKRPMTIKCATQCEFLIISPQSYQDIMRNVATRVAFFDSTVPGAKESSADGFHPSYLFMEGRYQQGHAFLTEGIASQPIIYVILEGSIEFHRCEDPNDDPAQKFQKEFGRSATDWAQGSRATQKYGKLTKGDIFSSLSCYPIQAYEPLSAVVSSPEAVVYHIEGAYLEKLPPKMLDTLRKKLFEGLNERLLNVRAMIPEAFVPAVRDGLSPTEKKMYSLELLSPKNSPSVRQRRSPTSRSTSPTSRNAASPTSRSASPLSNGSPVLNVPGVVCLS